MNRLDRSLEEARDLTTFEGQFYREDVRERLTEVRKIQRQYRDARNNIAAKEFDQYVDQLEELAKRTPRNPENNPVNIAMGVAQGLQSTIRNIRERTNTTEEIPEAEDEECIDDIVDEEPQEVKHLVVHQGGADTTARKTDATVPINDNKEEGYDAKERFGDNQLIERLTQYAKQKGVIGEENNIILAALCLSNGLHFGIEGPSGSGKTYLANIVMDLIPEEEVYTLELATESVLMNDVDRINERSFLYIPELQKPYQQSGKRTPMIAEIVKTLTEDRDAVRKVRIKQGEVSEFTIYAGITVVYTLADENAFKKDEETARRFIRLQTDTTEEHKDAIREAKAQQAFYTEENDSCQEFREELREYMTHLVHNHEEIVVRDPFAPVIKEYIPLTQRSPSFQSHYNKLVAASARFNHNRRFSTNEREEGENIKIVYTSLEDHRLIFSLYHNSMMTAMEQIDRTDDDLERITAVREKLEDEKGVDWGAAYEHAKTLMQDKFPHYLKAWEKYNDS